MNIVNTKHSSTKASKCKISKIVSTFSAIILGIGTCLLGYAAAFKANDIYQAVERFKDLNETLQVVKEISKNNQTILEKIEKQNLLIANKMGETYSTVSSGTKNQFRNTLNLISSQTKLGYPYMVKFGEGKNNEVSAAGEGKIYEVPAALEGGEKNAVSAVAREEKNNQTDQIISKWESIKTDEERGKYVENLFKTYFNINPKK